MPRKIRQPTAPSEGNDADLDPAWVAAIQRKLTSWYEHSKRDLPWRNDRDPYRILVSEMMLVQTTVTAVVPYFERFLARFPTIAALAAAEEGDVLKAWEGLGYYRRARQLHAAARAVVRDHGGAIPADADAIRKLPGVGPYIAGAVRSFAFDLPAPILEANTQRVVARWLAWPDDLKSAASQARLWQAAERLVPQKGSGEFNQAFMELGALVCLPRNPMCLVCPVNAECRARSLGLQERLPVQSPKPPPLAVSEACALVVRDARVLVVQRGAGGLWAGFWEFPTIHLSGADPARRSFEPPVDLAEGVRRLAGVRARIGPMVQEIRYSVTKHRVALQAFRAVGLDANPKPGAGMAQAAWVAADALANLTFSSAGRRCSAWLIRQDLASWDAERMP